MEDDKENKEDREENDVKRVKFQENEGDVEDMSGNADARCRRTR